MTIHFRIDSDNNTHQVWAQRQASSCAVASIWMARNKAKQMTFAESEWDLAWRIYSSVVQGQDFVPEAPAPMSFDPGSHDNNQSTFGNMFSRAGTFMGQVTQALANDGLRVRRLTTFSAGTNIDATRLADNRPAIVLLGWYSGGTRRGGHFIVAARRNSAGRVVYLDPWLGVLRELSPGSTYQSTGRFEQIAYISA